MERRLPLGAPEAVALGLIDAHAGPETGRFRALIDAQAALLVNDFAQALERKARDGRATSEIGRSRTTGAAELARMRMNFYGFDPSYHIARHRFVHRTPHAWTPLHLARHRRLGVAARAVSMSSRMACVREFLRAARRWRIGGRVQGVGFRPFVYRLAHL
jgi:putative two-component system protein, hydrogenase maturation factor HypX/HoxX